jgi:hypothetical protein
MAELLTSPIVPDISPEVCILKALANFRGGRGICVVGQMKRIFSFLNKVFFIPRLSLSLICRNREFCFDLFLCY